MEKIKITPDLKNKLKSGEEFIRIPPLVRRMFEGKKDAEIIDSFLEGENKDLSLIKRADNYVIISNKRLKKLNESGNIEKIKARESRNIPPKLTIWDIGEDLIALFPEIEKEYKTQKTQVDESGCTSCAARARSNKIVGELAKLSAEYPERTISNTMEKVLGPTFSRAIARIKYKEAPYGSLALPTKGAVHRLLEPIMHTHYTEGVRPSCLDCCRKHLGQSIILFQESEVAGYENHFWLGIGHLAEIESESLSTYPYFAKQIRDIRLAMMAKRDYVPNLMDIFDDIDVLDIAKEDSDSNNTV